MESHIQVLSDAKLSGRLVGSTGEQEASSYIASVFKKNGLKPIKGLSYQSTYAFKQERLLVAQSYFKIDNQSLQAGVDFYPLPFSGEKAVSGEIILGVNEPDNIWIIEVSESMPSQLDDAQCIAYYFKEAQQASSDGATAVIFTHTHEKSDQVQKWNQLENLERLTIPVIWTSKSGTEKISQMDADYFEVALNIQTQFLQENGVHVLGYLDKGSDQTILIVAPYCNETVQEEKNIAGVSLLMELAESAALPSQVKHNILFVALSNKAPEHKGLMAFLSQTDLPVSSLKSVLILDQINGSSTEVQLLQTSNDDLSSPFQSQGIPTYYVTHKEAGKSKSKSNTRYQLFKSALDIILNTRDFL
jgi:aminopeptidase YwaD